MQRNWNTSALWECKLENSLVAPFIKSNIELSCDPAVLLLGKHPEDPNAGTQTAVCTPVFTAVSHTAVGNKSRVDGGTNWWTMEWGSSPQWVSTTLHMDEACCETSQTQQARTLVSTCMMGLESSPSQRWRVLLSGAGAGELAELGFLWQLKFGLYSGDGHTTSWMYFVTLNCTLINVESKDVYFTTVRRCIFGDL